LGGAAHEPVAAERAPVGAARIAPYFPLAHGVPRVDDRCVVSGIVYVIRQSLQW
jgi:hypothetical protein